MTSGGSATPSGTIRGRADVGLTASRRRFDQIVRDYVPLPYEAFPADDRRFTRPMHHVLNNRDRLWFALDRGVRYLPRGRSTVVDFGAYPGSLLRILHRLVPPGPRLIGVGLMTSDDFRLAMRDDCGADILTVTTRTRTTNGGRTLGNTHCRRRPASSDRRGVPWPRRTISSVTTRTST